MSRSWKKNRDEWGAPDPKDTQKTRKGGKNQTKDWEQEAEEEEKYLDEVFKD